jgi:hypothetical protein
MRGDDSVPHNLFFFAGWRWKLDSPKDARGCFWFKQRHCGCCYGPSTIICDCFAAVDSMRMSPMRFSNVKVVIENRVG